MLAGFAHLCLGDIATFTAYRRLGPRIGVLMVCSISPPVALFGEWLVLGTTVHYTQLICSAAILLMVALAVAPMECRHLSASELKTGIFAGVFSAICQGSSAVLNRIAFDQIGGTIPPWVTAFYRVTAGALGVGAYLLVLHLSGRQPFLRPAELIPHKKIQGHPLGWMTLSILLGPVLGMIFIMRAFETTPAGLVQATLATLPVFMIPIAWVFDGNTPSKRSVAAGTCAVGLTAGLILMSR
jgi:drug/metabolite transporter (DMT)-like permease